MSGVVLCDAAGVHIADEEALTLLGLTFEQLGGSAPRPPDWQLLDEHRAPLDADTCPVQFTLARAASAPCRFAIRHGARLRWLWATSTPALGRDGARGTLLTFSAIGIGASTNGALRSALAFELHDTLGPLLAGGRLLAAAESQPRLEALLQQAQQRLSALSRALLSHAPETGPFSATLAAIAERTSTLFGVTCERPPATDTPEPAAHQAHHAALVAEEAVANALRHGAARHLKLSFTHAAGRFRLTIQDDGRGLSPEAGRGLGLASMHDRARRLGGVLTLTTVKPRGLAVTLDWPAATSAAPTAAPASRDLPG